MEVLFIAPVDRFSVKDTGYGTAAAGISYVLEEMKKEGRLKDVHYLNTAAPNPKDIPDTPVDVAICVVHPNSFLQQTRGLEIVVNALKKAKKRYLSVVWETTPLPPRWKPLFEGELFDALITPSYFVAEGLRRMSTKPVYYYPHYIHVDDIPAVNIDEKLNEEQFTALYIGQHTKRKGLEDAVIAFMRALGQQEDARLVLKYHKMTEREINPEQMIYHAVITNSTKTKCKVYSITEMLDRERMYGLYHMSSVLFFPSRGEGFGLPLAEAMAAGISCIYTGWSSMPEVGTAPGNIELRYILDESVGMYHHGYDIGSKYAVPLIGDCIDALRYKYDEWKKDKEKYYLAVRQNRDIIVERFGYKPVSDCIEHFIHSKDGFAPKEVDERMMKVVGQDQGQRDKDISGKEDTA